MNRRKTVPYASILILLLLSTFFLGKNHQRKEIVHSIPTREKVVALTYDDGPHPIYTPQILAILKEHHVKATFFMIGASVEKYPSIVKQVIREGHSIGNHTYSHPRNLATLRNQRVREEMENCETTIERNLGRRVAIFRPPKGIYSAEVIREAKEAGYQMVLWSVCGDNRKMKDPKAMANRVVQSVKPGNIILLHDGTFDSRWRDVEATPIIVEGLLKKGYRFVSVPQLLGIFR